MALLLWLRAARQELKTSPCKGTNAGPSQLDLSSDAGWLADLMKRSDRKNYVSVTEKALGSPSTLHPRAASSEENDQTLLVSSGNQRRVAVQIAERHEAEECE